MNVVVFDGNLINWSVWNNTGGWPSSKKNSRTLPNSCYIFYVLGTW